MKNQKMKFAAANLPQILRSPRWLAMMFLLPLLMMMIHFAMAAPTVEPAPVAAAAEKFDHVKTGFNLTGAHATARCTSCHINNVFKGAPRDCATCHRAANLMAATSKPSNHINTNAQCDTCHKTTVWTPAIFSHVGMPDGQCATCHNGTTAMGKSRNHIPVPATISCDNCHKTTSWLQYAFSHKNINSGCSDCHGGQTFTGVPVQPKAKPNNHMLTGLDCGACHSTTNFVILKSGAPVTLPSGHFPTFQPCSVCHSGGSFIPGRMNHIGATDCIACHVNGNDWLGLGLGGLRSQASSSTSAHTLVGSSVCSKCHTSTSDFKVASLTVAPFGHMPTTQTCITCHSAGYGSGNAVMSHAGISSNCKACHAATSPFLGNPPILLKSSLHVPTARVTGGTECETCHSRTATAPGGFSSLSPQQTMKHTGIVNLCTDCHGKPWTGVTPITNDATHISITSPAFPSVKGCEACHSVTVFSAFSGTIMNHSGVTSCKVCHNGNSFQGGIMPMYKASGGGHNDLNAECSGCHNTSTFASAAGGMPTNHMPTNIATCTVCHKGSPKSPANTTMGTAGHAGIVTTNCAQCHNGQPFYGNGSTTGFKATSKANFPPHVSTSSDCSTCHYPNTNGFTSFAGATGGALPLNHLPTIQPCTTCHTKFDAGSGHMSHVGIVSGCATCHDNKTFAVGMKPTPKPTSHIKTGTAPCEACHSISNFSTFAGDAKTMMKHTAVSTIACADCHGLGINPVGGIVAYPSNHVPTAGVTNGAMCDTCHSKTNFTTFSGSPMNHTGLAVGSCDGCHTAGKNLFAGVSAMLKPSTHIPYSNTPTGGLLNGANMMCDFCHKLTSIGGFATLSISSTTMHNGSRGNGSGRCTDCHLSGTTFLGVLGRKAINHDNRTYTVGAHDCSESGCHKPVGNEGASYITWN